MFPWVTVSKRTRGHVFSPIFFDVSSAKVMIVVGYDAEDDDNDDGNDHDNGDDGDDNVGEEEEEEESDDLDNNDGG